MHFTTSLTLRLTLLFGISAATLFIVFSWLIDHAIQKHFVDGDTSELEIIANAVEEGMSKVNNEHELTAQEERFSDILTSHHRASLHIIGNDGEAIYTSRGASLVAFAQTFDAISADSSIHHWEDAEHAYRIMIRHVSNDQNDFHRPYTMYIAVEIDFHISFLREFHKTLWLMGSFSIAILCFAGWVAARLGQAPLRDMVTTIRRISTGEPNIKLRPDSIPSELSELAVSFNEMIQRVDDSIYRLSAFNADIAHELRTPITNLMTQTQVILTKDRTLDEYQETLYSNMEELERMAQMVNDMLFLAQADNRTPVKDIVLLDLASEVKNLFEYYHSWTNESGIALRLEGTAFVMANRQMLQRALGNLLSNAIQHTARDKSIRVLLSTTEERNISVVIENPGPDISSEHLPKLFDRFYRIDPSRQHRTSGSGLGLAIVKSIINAHNGKIEVTSRGGLIRFHITLPGVYDDALQAD